MSSDPGRFSAELNSLIAFFNSLPARHSVDEVELPIPNGHGHCKVLRKHNQRDNQGARE
ncbi:MAG: hypothetical protein RXO22_08315 [Thermocladium sp.]